MLNRCLLIIGLLIVMTIHFGCASRNMEAKAPYLDKNWGRSYETAKFNQIANPEAEKNLDPVKGLDAEAAKTNMEKYRKSFEKETERPVYNIDIGSLGGS